MGVMSEEQQGHLSKEDFQRLRRENPQGLFRHLTELHRDFVFGVEDHRDDPQGWGGELVVVVNRNLSVHLVPRFNEAMSTIAELPQFCVFPDAEQPDQQQRTRIDVDGEGVEGVIFFVDPDDYDTLRREAIEIADAYGDWDAIPDSYYLHTELVRFLNRVVLEDPVAAAEREFDFRLGLVGGEAPPPLDEEQVYSAEELISPDEDEEPGPDDHPPPEDFRSHQVEWGGRNC